MRKPIILSVALALLASVVFAFFNDWFKVFAYKKTLKGNNLVINMEGYLNRKFYYVLNGAYKRVDKASQTIVSGEYREGKRNGKWRWRSFDGNFSVNSDFRNGDGLYYRFTSPLKATEVLCRSGRVPEDTVDLEWYENGSMKKRQELECKITRTRNTVKISTSPTGQYTELYPSGRKREQGMCIDGARIGTWTTWYPSGETESVKQYGKYGLTGKYIEWYPNGNKRKEYMYADDDLNGVCITWHPNGDTESVKRYRYNELIKKDENTHNPAAVKKTETSKNNLHIKNKQQDPKFILFKIPQDKIYSIEPLLKPEMFVDIFMKGSKKEAETITRSAKINTISTSAKPKGHIQTITIKVPEDIASKIKTAPERSIIILLRCNSGQKVNGYVK